MKYKKIKYDTVREVSFAPEDIARLSDALQEQGAPCHFSHLIAYRADPVRLAQVKDVIETGWPHPRSTFMASPRLQTSLSGVFG
jgi:hypothetical protein